LAHPKSRHHDILVDEDVRRWYTNLQQASHHTADVQRRALGRFLKAIGESPKGYLRLPKKARADRLQDFVAGESAKGRAGSYVVGYVTGVQSWLRHNGAEIGRRINIRGRHLKPVASEYKVPSSADLEETIRQAGPKISVRVALIACSGVRPEVLGFWKGTDGLRVKDLPELRIDGQEVTWDRIPARVNVRAELAKTGKRYFTFIGPLACAIIKSELEARLAKGQRVEANSAIVESTLRNGKPFISTPNVTKQVREAMRRAGIREPPYIWRSYFSNRCLAARMNYEWREFMLGHKGGIAGVYTMGKQIPDDMVEAMRSEYEKACEYIEPNHQAGVSDPLKSFAPVLLEAFGVPPGQVDLAELTQAQIVELLKDKVVKPVAEASKRPRQRLILPEELEEAQRAGYLYRDQLRDGRVVVELAA